MSDILLRAHQIVFERSEEKERQYGPFRQSMETATEIFNLISPDTTLSTQDMYRAMIALKLSREAHAHKKDNLLDLVAYIAALDDYEDYIAREIEYVESILQEEAQSLIDNQK